MTLNLAEFERLKELYNQAVEEEKEDFVFNNVPLLVSYTKYLIEYLEGKFKEELHNKRKNKK